MNRRGFLGGILAGLASPAIVKAESLMKLAVPPRFILWGDGIHDDSPALAELLRGGSAMQPNGTLISRSHDGVLMLPRGTYSMGRPVDIQGNFLITRSEFRARDDFVGDVLFRFRDSSNGHFTFNTLQGPRRRIPEIDAFAFDRGVELVK